MGYDIHFNWFSLPFSQQPNFVQFSCGFRWRCAWLNRSGAQSLCYQFVCIWWIRQWKISAPFDWVIQFMSGHHLRKWNWWRYDAQRNTGYTPMSPAPIPTPASWMSRAQPFSICLPWIIFSKPLPRRDSSSIAIRYRRRTGRSLLVSTETPKSGGLRMNLQLLDETYLMQFSYDWQVSCRRSFHHSYSFLFHCHPRLGRWLRLLPVHLWYLRHLELHMQSWGNNRFWLLLIWLPRRTQIYRHRLTTLTLLNK